MNEDIREDELEKFDILLGDMESAFSSLGKEEPQHAG